MTIEIVLGTSWSCRNAAAPTLVTKLMQALHGFEDAGLTLELVRWKYKFAPQSDLRYSGGLRMAARLIA